MSASAGVSCDECHADQDRKITPIQYKTLSVALWIPAIVAGLKQYSWVRTQKTEKFNHLWFDIFTAIWQ